MTQKTKQLKQFLTFSILAGFLFVSCQVEQELANPNLEEKSGRIVHKKFEDLIKETEFKVAFDKVMRTSKESIGKKEAIASRTVMENQYGFTIVDQPAKVLVSHGITSYNFLITRAVNTPNVIENLIINIQDNQPPKAYLYKFESATPITDEFNHTTFTGVKTLTPIVYNIGQAKEDAMPGFMCETIEEWHCANHSSYQDGCEGYGTSYRLCTPIGGGGGIGSTGTGVTFTSGGSGSSGSGTGNTSTGTGGNTGSSGNGTYTPVVIAPVPPPACAGCPIGKDTCETVAPLLNPTKANLKSTIEALQPSAGQSAGESGTSLVKSPTGIFDTNPITPSATALELIVPDGGDVYGSIHTHPIFPNCIPMFSWGDVHSLFETYDNSAPHNSGNVTIILVVKTFDNLGNPVNTAYSLVISDPVKFLTKMDDELAALTGTLEEKKAFKNEKLKNYFDNVVGRGTENWEKGFLNYFKDYNISLMKSNPSLTGWSQLAIPDFKLPLDQQTVTLNPCN